MNLPRFAVAVAVLTLASCSSTAPGKTAAPTPVSAGDQFTAWYSGGGNQRINDVAADVKALVHATRSPEKTATCQALSAHVTAALAYGPIPDTEAQVHWGKVLDLLGAASTDCAAGATDAARDVEAQIGLEAAQREAGLASARLDALATAAG